MKLVKTQLNEDSIYDNPIFKKEYLSTIKAKAKEKYKEFNPHNIMPLLNKIMSIERNHINELNQIAKDIIIEQYGSIIGDTELDLKIVQIGDEEKDEITQQILDPDFFKQASSEQEQEEIETKEQLEKLQPEINKRRAANILTQGEAVNVFSLFQLAKDKLNKIDPKLADYYTKLHKESQGFYWMDQIDLEEMISNMPETTNTSSVDFEGEEGDETPVIKARGLNFAVLLHEAVKGIYELIMTQGIPKDPVTAAKVLSKTDVLAHEKEDIAYGEYIAGDLRDFINTIPNVDRYPNMREFIYGEMMKMDATHFVNLMSDILEDSPKAKTYLTKLVNKIINEISEYEKSQVFKEPKDIDDEVITKKEEPTVEKEIDYSKLGQAELNYQLNKAIDNNDFETIKKINKYLKESLSTSELSLMNKIFEEVKEKSVVKEFELTKVGDDYHYNYKRDKFNIYPSGNQYILQINGKNKVKGSLKVCKAAIKDYLSKVNESKNGINENELLDFDYSENKLLNFVQENLKDTIFKYEPKNTKYSKKGYLRFTSSYDGCVLYVSKNRIILINRGRFNSSVSNEHDARYKINDKVDFMNKLQNLYNYYRFFTEHYPEPGATYSLIDGRPIKKTI